MRICGTSSIILCIRRCIGHIAWLGLSAFLIMPMSVVALPSIWLVVGRIWVGVNVEAEGVYDWSFEENSRTKPPPRTSTSSMLFYAFDIFLIFSVPVFSISSNADTAPLDMRRDVQEIFRTTPHHKQVMMFSATLAKDIRATCKKFMANVSSNYLSLSTSCNISSSAFGDFC
jgi:hypothetical protein